MSNFPQEETILDKLYVCQVDLHIWSGQVKTDMSRDIEVGKGGRLPSDKVVKAGRKYVINPDALKGFSRVRSQVRRTLARIGMPFMGGWAVPMDSKDQLDSALEEAVQEFDSLKQRLVTDYDGHVQSWIDDNPDDAEVIRRGKLEIKDVESKLSATIKRFRISPASSEDAAVLEEEAKGLGNELLAEIRQQAEKIYVDTFQGKDKVSSNVSLTLKGIRDKLNGLCFLNNKFRPMVQMLDGILDGCVMHREGRYLTSPFLYEVVAAVLILSDEKKLEQMCAGVVTPSSLGADLMPVTEDQLELPEEEPEEVPAQPEVQEEPELQEEPVIQEEEQQEPVSFGGEDTPEEPQELSGPEEDTTSVSLDELTGFGDSADIQSFF